MPACVWTGSRTGGQRRYNPHTSHLVHWRHRVAVVSWWWWVMKEARSMALMVILLHCYCRFWPRWIGIGSTLGKYSYYNHTTTTTITTTTTAIVLLTTSHSNRNDWILLFTLFVFLIIWLQGIRHGFRRKHGYKIAHVSSTLTTPTPRHSCYYQCYTTHPTCFTSLLRPSVVFSPLCVCSQRKSLPSWRRRKSS
jgi:hypothetical protein